MPKHGTAYTLGQYNEVLGAIQRALPRALEGTDPKILLPLLQKSGERVEGDLGKLLRSLSDPSSVATLPAPFVSVRVQQRTFRVKLNYGEALEVKGATGFSYVNLNLTDANFKTVSGTGLSETDAIAVNFGEYVESSDAVSRLGELGLRVGIPKELADFSKAYPNSQELVSCLPLVALGDSWRDPDGRLNVVDLGGRASSRRLDLYPWSSRWDGDWWFLAFRK